MPELLISADSHVNPPPDLWQHDPPARLKDRVPRVESTPEGDVWVTDKKVQAVIGLSFMAGQDYKNYQTRVHYKEMRPGSWDPKARLADMDQDGIQVDVLYGGGPMKYDDPELRAWCLGRYNDWLFELEAATAGRLVGVPVLPIESVDECVTELRRVAKKGARGVQVDAFPDTSGVPDYSSPAWEPLWNELETIGVPLSFHIQGPRGQALQKLYDPTPGVKESYIALAPLGVAELIAQLIFCGVCERHPRLNWIVVETGIGWIPYFLERMDATFRKHRYWTKSVIKEKPSFYWYRQGHATFIEDHAGVKLIEDVGVGNAMWSSDYPHSDTTWPRSREVVEEHFAKTAPDVRRKVVYENAARLYRLG